MEEGAPGGQEKRERKSREEKEGAQALEAHESLLSLIHSHCFHRFCYSFPVRPAAPPADMQAYLGHVHVLRAHEARQVLVRSKEVRLEDAPALAWRRREPPWPWGAVAPVGGREAAAGGGREKTQAGGRGRGSW